MPTNIITYARRQPSTQHRFRIHSNIQYMITNAHTYVAHIGIEFFALRSIIKRMEWKTEKDRITEQTFFQSSCCVRYFRAEHWTWTLNMSTPFLVRICIFGIVQPATDAVRREPRWTRKKAIFNLVLLEYERRLLLELLSSQTVFVRQQIAGYRSRTFYICSLLSGFGVTRK